MTPWKDRRPDKYHAQDAKTSTSRYDIRFAENSFTFFSFSVFVLRPRLACRADICFFLKRAMKHNQSWLEMSVETIMSGLGLGFLSIDLYKGRLSISWGLKSPLSKPYDSPYIVPNQQILVWLSFYYRKFLLCFRWEHGTDSQFPKESDLICNLSDKCFQTLREQQ